MEKSKLKCPFCGNKEITREEIALEDDGYSAYETFFCAKCCTHLKHLLGYVISKKEKDSDNSKEGE